jgi:phage regulator Rha-like protein
MNTSMIPAERIEQAILFLRDEKILLSTDLATLYGVSPKVLIQAVKRNIERFPPDFMFQLTVEEDRALRSQFVTLKKGRGEHRKYPPYAFTEQGVAMLSSVLRSKRAIQVNIEIIRAFVRMRHLMASHKELARKLDELENRYDEQFRVVFEAIRQLMEPLEEKRRGRIGFRGGDLAEEPP